MNLGEKILGVAVVLICAGYAVALGFLAVITWSHVHWALACASTAFLAGVIMFFVAFAARSTRILLEEVRRD